MPMNAVPLDRRFVEIPSAYQHDDIPLDEAWSGYFRSAPKLWDALEQEYRVVILADAGAGKTFELRNAAERLASAGKNAFFIRVEDVDDNFDAAFEIGSAQAFEAWLHGTDEAWFFLDSVDEVRLTRPRAFEDAMHAFGRRIRNARHRAHVYISSRPYAWRMSLDRMLIEEVLPFEQLQLERGLDADDADSEDAIEGGIAIDEGEHGQALSSALRLYMLAPLDTADIKRFAEQSGVADPSAFIDELERRALLTLAQLPFDLADLIATWLEAAQLESRLDVLQSSIARQLADATAAFKPLSPNDATQGAELLAMAALLTGLAGIALPGSPVEDAIDPCAILEGWSHDRIAALLKSGLFGDPIYDQVRFRHREVRELLAARWMAAQLSSDAGRFEVERMVFRNNFREEIIPPRVRPVLPWLILFDEAIRTRLLKDHPDIAIEGGDASRLSPEVRRAMLATLIAKIIDPISSVRGPHNNEIARIAQPDLANDVSTLIDQYADNDDAIFVLGRLVWQGKMASALPRLITIATDPERGIYARIAAIRAVMSVGTPEQGYALWTKVNADETLIPRQLVAELANNAEPTTRSVQLLVASLDRLEPRREIEVTGLSHALHEFIDRLPIGPDGQPEELLVDLASGLLGFLEREPFIDRGECHVSEEFRWLMPMALHCIERLIATHRPAALSDTAYRILAAAPAVKFWGSDEYRSRKSAIDRLLPKWPELNDALFWWTIDRHKDSEGAKGENVTDDWSVSWLGHFWFFDQTSFNRLVGWVRERSDPDDQLIALSRAVRTLNELGRPDALLAALRDAVAGNAALEEALERKLNPVDDTKRRIDEYDQLRKDNREQRKASNLVARAGFVRRLTENPDLVRHPPGLRADEFSNDQYRLMMTIQGSEARSSRAGGTNWRALIPEFGLEVATAYRDAAVAFWRAYDPGIRSEGANTSAIPYALMFAMAGLEIDFSEDEARIGTLGVRERRRALRFIFWELNGFPAWFEAFHRRWPKQSTDFVWNEIRWELENSVGQSIHYALHDIVFHAPWLHAELGRRLYEWLSDDEAPNLECLATCRAIMIGGGIPASDIATLATAKLGSDQTPPDQIITWHAIRTDADPAVAVPALKALQGANMIVGPSQFGASFSSALIGSRGSPRTFFGEYRTPSYLKDLYVLTHQWVKVGDDIHRAGTGAYSPTVRDDAQDAREQLFGLLTADPAEMSNQKIAELSNDHPEPTYRPYMRERAYAHATANGDEAPWTADQVARLALRIKTRAAGEPIKSKPDATA